MAFATTDDVVKRLEEEPTPRMLVMIEEYLEEASDAARYYGKEWTDLDVPQAVRRIVASAVARFIRNPDDYSTSRAGDETVSWQIRGEIDWFTEQQIERIARAAAVGQLRGFGTMQMSAETNGHRRHEDAIYVPINATGSKQDKPFPYIGVYDPLAGAIFP